MGTALLIDTPLGDVLFSLVLSKEESEDAISDSKRLEEQHITSAAVRWYQMPVLYYSRSLGVLNIASS